MKKKKEKLHLDFCGLPLSLVHNLKAHDLGIGNMLEFIFSMQPKAEKKLPFK